MTAPAKKQHVNIKGVKEGLLFVLDDTCRYTDLLAELEEKLTGTHNKILSGPQIYVQVKLGERILNEAEKEQIRELIGKRGNLLVQSIETEQAVTDEIIPGLEEFKVIRGMVRSGQTVSFEGNLMLLGDVNPGGSILASGDIIIMGSLRGMAHAGMEGKEDAIIGASHLRPTQLRIANVISRPPDEWGVEEAFMEFAYIRDGAMEIDKIHNLHRIRP
ncbi:septum site-determining protein MinC [Paenibacillus sp. CC-CFT747]|nr:septum site-determining protein MinC [Paenibacillus sp. CC-CFT747]